MLNDGADERRCFSTRDCRDADRWQEMPSLSAQYSRMDLHQQRYIRTVHPSLLQQSSLISLKITQCVQLQTLPDDLGQLRQLQELDLTDSCLLQSLPESIGALTSLKRLSLACSLTTGNKVLHELPTSLGNLMALEELYLDKCKVLRNLPVGPWERLRILHMRECKSITELPESVGGLISLKEWNMAKCIALTQLPESVGQLQSLEDLTLSKCKSLRSLPQTMGQCSSMVWLDVRGCKRLTELPHSLITTPLRILDLGQCKALNTVIPNIPSLQELRINWVISMDLIPSELHDRVVTIESG